MNYDVIVIGGGHAGCEAAAASAKLGSQTLLLTMNLQTIAQMSCNPAMGGIAKGQIVREIDALGALSGKITDETMLQFKMLNKSKGPSVWSPRAQSDRMLFAMKWREELENIENLSFYQDTAKHLVLEKNKVVGVETIMGVRFLSKAVILTGGTFLNGIVHIGDKQIGGGRISEKSSLSISDQIAAFGIRKGRLKTGTPPRLDGRSLDYSKMEAQKGDEKIVGFSFLPTNKITNSQQLSCYVTYTNSTVHEILKEGFDKSPMYQGRILGSGPRYCPSIEDKISRFADRERHQLFAEPEGFKTNEVYLNGFSTSLPIEVQQKALSEIVGCKNAKMLRPGYAIEYDFFPPDQLWHSLETKAIENLFFAGQINGTTGYEEAACQGLMAGINAYNKINEKPPFILQRNEAYIGVLIDDLITKGTDEPYRMFTSRAEFRTLLRQDNADIRLTEKGYSLGLASEERMHLLERKQKNILEINKFLNHYKPEPKLANSYLENLDTNLLALKQPLSQILLRPGAELFVMKHYLKEIEQLFIDYPEVDIEQAEIQIKYHQYIEREREMVEKFNQFEQLHISPSFDYSKLSLSNESKQKLEKFRPVTLGQASRISGVSPSDMQILMLYLRN